MSLSLMATMLIIYYIILFIKISSRCELNVTKDLGVFLQLSVSATIILSIYYNYNRLS